MQLQLAVGNAFTQLSLSLEQLTPEQYDQPCTNLSNSTIGQHVRHIIEMFQCLENGYATGVINYENRKRDRKVETDMRLAIDLLENISRGLGRDNRSLVLEGVYHDDSSEPMQFETNYYREIVYNLEHAIHHMALIRVGLKELKDLELPESFGLASATLKFKRSCAQ